MTKRSLNSAVDNYGRNPQYLLTEKGRDFLLALRRDHPAQYSRLREVALAAGVSAAKDVPADAQDGQVGGGAADE